MPSIKESDRFTSNDRVAMVITGLCLTLFGGVLTWAVYLAGYIASPTLVLLLAGPIMMGMACFAQYKGNIKVTNEVLMACPQCGDGPMEFYEEKLDTKRDVQYRVIYNKVKTTTLWATKMHCMSCEWIASRPTTGREEVRGAKQSMCKTSKRSTPETDKNNVELEKIVQNEIV